MAAPQGIIQTLRRLLGRNTTLGSGLFPIGQGGGAQGIFYAQSWEFQKLWSTVFANPTGYRCVQAIESNFSRPPWMVLPYDKPWPQHGQEEEIKSHPILDLLNQPYTDPSGRMSGTTMQRTIARDLELCGKSFWVKIPNGSGPTPGALRRLPAQRVTVVGNQDDELLGFVYTDRSGQRSAILPENVIYLRYPHPERIYDGIAPALMAAMGAETDTAGARFNRDLLHNDGAIPGYLVIQNMTPDQFSQWKGQWDSGQQPGRVRFMSGDQASYVKVGMSNQELTYSDLRDASQDDIMRSFGVPRAVALDVSHETYANAEQEKAIFMQQNILPKWILVADELTQQLGEEQNIRICFDLAGIEEMQGSSDKFVDRSTKLMGWKVITVNEVRRDLGLPPVDWGDEPVAPAQPMSAVPEQPGGASAPPAPPQNVHGQGTPPARLPEHPAPPLPSHAAMTDYAVADELTDEGALKELELAKEYAKTAATDVKPGEGKVGDYRARHLIRWFNEGAGGRIAWGSPGDYAECLAVAAPHLRDPHGFCAERHHDALGIWPATHGKQVREAEGRK